jgi:hypothetical protein
MARVLESAVCPMIDWAGAAEHQYREASGMMEVDDHLLGDVGITREELDIDRLQGTSARPLGRREPNYRSSSANVRMAQGVL